MSVEQNTETPSVRVLNVRVWNTGEIIDVVAPVNSAAKGLAGTTIDGTGLVLAPGLVDLHVHFRDPGQTEKEDMRSGSAAAAAGGFTDVCIQPNTVPAADGEPLSSKDPIGERLLKQGFVSVLDYLELYPDAFEIELPVDYTLAAAASIGREGKQATRASMWEPFLAGEGADAGHPVVALSDDGSAVSDETLHQVLENAKLHGIFLMEHCEHHTSGVINDGEVSRKLGVEGVPSSTEMAIVSRDIEAARTSGAHIHLQHVSTSEAFDAVRRAKAEGISVTCETAPHYFALSDQAVEKYGSLAKMNPPLRSEADRQATLEAIADGTVDVIATDHAPHTVSEKSSGLLESPNGIIGLETSYALANSYLVESGLISHDRLIELMSLNPADLEGIQRVNIDQLLDVYNTAAAHEESSDLATPHRVIDVRGMAVDSDTDDADDGAVAPRINLSLLAPHAEWTVEPEAFLSKARNTPFGGQTLTGRAVATIVNATLFDVAGTLKGESWID